MEGKPAISCFGALREKRHHRCGACFARKMERGAVQLSVVLFSCWQLTAPHSRRGGWKGGEGGGGGVWGGGGVGGGGRGGGGQGGGGGGRGGVVAAGAGGVGRPCIAGQQLHPR